MDQFVPRHGWGAEGKRAAVCITFDNFGEAAEVEMGWWGDRPVGQHVTADFIPTLIDALGAVRGTYFIEGINAEIYPDAIRRWHASGNEVGLHAWRHEFWTRTESPQRREILRRSIAAMATLEIKTVGFRPPGGAMTDEVWAEFAEAGLLYCSDLAEPGPRRQADIISLPFEWRGVDAFFFEEIGAPVRLSLGYAAECYPLAHWAGELDRIVADILRDGAQATVIFHPHLLATDPHKLAIFAGFVDTVSRHPDIYVAPARDLARFVRDEMRQTQPDLEKVQRS